MKMYVILGMGFAVVYDRRIYDRVDSEYPSATVGIGAMGFRMMRLEVGP